MSHANARLTPAGRLLTVQRIEAAVPQAHVARQMGLSRGTIAKWWNGWCAEGNAGLVDRSSRPHRSPRRTPARVEERICRLRRRTRRGPVYLSARTGVPAATIWRILARNGLNRLSWIDRPTGRVIRRYERSSPGEPVHLDVKKVGQILPGGGWRIHGRNSAQAKRSKRRPVGYTLWVPIPQSWALTRGFALHPGTSCVASFTGSSRCWHGLQCVAGARRTSSTNTEELPDQPRQGFGHP